MAVGAPPPAPATPIRAIERGARVRSGWPARPLPPHQAKLPRRRPRTPAPEIHIGKPRERIRPPEDLSHQPLYLLIPDSTSWSTGAGARAALEAARRFAGGRGAILVDLDTKRHELSRTLGSPSLEGVAEALEFGMSLEAVGREIGEGLRFVPLGSFRGTARELYEHEGWKRLIRTARRRGDRILAYLPAGQNVDMLASSAGAALLLSPPEAEARLRSSLPAGLPVVGSVEPPPMPAGTIALEDLDEPRAPQSPPELDPSSAAEAPPAPETPPSAEASSALPGTAPSPVAVPLASAPAPETTPPPPEPRHEPPMQAPKARGLTLSEWLSAEEDKLRELEARPVDDPSLDLLPDADTALSTPEPAATAAAPPPPQFPPETEERPEPEPLIAGAPAGEAPAHAAAVEPSEPAERQPLPPHRLPHRYSVPRTSARAELLIRVAAVVILAYWTYYIVWRWTGSLNLDALWFSIPLVLAETWGWVTACFLVFTVWKLNHRKPPPAPEGLSVDVFITTFGEPLEVIRRTTISAREIRYPHNTYVLDDGRREEVRAMAHSLGVGYITRENNDHAKAGNLNNALKYTSGDFILQLDADHAPLPHILHRLLGFFGDEKVAFVQTPQDFYNLDSFTSHVDEETQRVWEEQKLFFSVLQPGKDAWNTAFFCGSCGVLRRSALQEIGGFSVQSVTEDVETSLLLHARGWRSVYYGESLAYGLAASSAAAFHIQQGRWAQGSMQILRKMNPLTLPGLTIAQRLGYFYSLSSFAVGLQKLVFYGSPIIFFFTGVLPIRSLDREFLVRFLPYLVLSLFLYELLARGLGFTWIAERYQMAKFWTYTRALPAYLTKKRIGFRVTPKGPAHVPFRTYAPHIVLMIVTVLAVYWATFAYDRGWVEYSVPGWESLAFQANFTWALLNFVLAGYVVRLSIRLQHKRQDHRFSDRFPIYIQPRGSQGQLGERQLALTEDLNAGGASFRSVSRFEDGTRLKLTLPLSTREVTVEAVVVHSRPDPEPSIPAFLHGVEFRNIALDVRDAIEIHCTHHAVPMRQMQYSAASSLTASQAWTGEPMEKRSTVRLPAWVLLGEGAGETQRKQNVAFLEEIGPGGGSLIMSEPVPPETPIVFEVPGTNIRGEGHTTYSHALETPIGVRFVVGVRTAKIPGKGGAKSSWRSLFSRGRPAALGVLLAIGAIALGHRPTSAQFVAFGTAEANTRDHRLLLLGGTLQSTSEGFGVFGSAMGYRLVHPADPDPMTLDAVAPSFGVMRVTPENLLQVGVGYLFLASEAARVLGAPGGGSDGVLVSGLARRTAPALTAEVATSYNFGDRYFWSRGRGLRPTPLRLRDAPLSLGGEVVFQGGGTGAGFHSFQLAPVLEIPIASAFRLLVAAGWHTDDLERTQGGGFPYYKAEFTYAAGEF